MSERRYYEIDVFTAKPLAGNPLAVIVDAEDLDRATMQRLATWLNFSETAFLLPPTSDAADLRVRIFTPRQELPFAGHPTVGSAHAALLCGKVDANRDALVLECAAGLLPVKVEGDGPARVIRVQAPPARFDHIDAASLEALAKALRCSFTREPRAVCNGPTWLTCELANAAEVRALAPDMASIADLCTRLFAVGVCVFGRGGEPDSDMAVRAFCPADGIPEDPVTGSANAAIGAYLNALDGLETCAIRYTASQGREVGRDGRVHVEATPDGTVTIGGQCVTIAEGQLHL